MNRYFQNFAPVQYGSRVAINIMERTAILNSIFKNVYTFYPYQVKDGMRARTIAERYYGDPNLDWLVYFSNNIVDPYHQWPMDKDTFNAHVIEKYGSIQAARTKIISYRVNWYEDDRVLSRLQYNSLPHYEKKYWTPVFDDNNIVAGWKRREMDHLAIAQDGDGNVTLSIDETEQEYWIAVTALDYEEEENAKKSNIKLLDSKLVTTAVDNLKRLHAE
jgi:hypothetical protein